MGRPIEVVIINASITFSVPGMPRGLWLKLIQAVPPIVKVTWTEHRNSSADVIGYRLTYGLHGHEEHSEEG